MFSLTEQDAKDKKEIAPATDKQEAFLPSQDSKKESVRNKDQEEAKKPGNLGDTGKKTPFRSFPMLYWKIVLENEGEAIGRDEDNNYYTLGGEG